MAETSKTVTLTSGKAKATTSTVLDDGMPGVPCPDSPGYVYTGMRYVPIFNDPAEWANTNTYEPLTIVIHEGNSYTSKTFVPLGIDIANSQYWVLTGNYNYQVELYRQEVKTLEGNVAVAEQKVANLEKVVYPTFGSVELAKAFEPMTGIIHVLGYYSAGDGGEAFYSVDSVDKGVNSFLLANGKYANQIIKDFVGVRQFGAKGDGVTDDTASLNKALSSGAGTVILDGGDYVTSSSLIINRCLNFIGHGKDSIIRVAQSSTSDAMSVAKNAGDHKSSTYMVIKDLCIVPHDFDWVTFGDGTTGANGLSISVTSQTGWLHNVTVENVIFGVFNGKAIKTAVSDGLNNGIASLRITNCISYGGGLDLTRIGDSSVISKNGFQGTGVLNISSISGAANITVSDNNITLSGGVFIGENCVNLAFERNQCELVSTFTGANAAYITVSNTSCVKIKDCNLNTHLNSTYGIYLDKAFKAIITGNDFKHMGVYIKGVGDNYCSVHENIFIKLNSSGGMVNDGKPAIELNTNAIGIELPVTSSYKTDNCHYTIDSTGNVMFYGRIDPGATLAVGDVLMTLPLYPYENAMKFSVGIFVGGISKPMLTTVSGNTLICQEAQTTAVSYVLINGISYHAQYQ